MHACGPNGVPLRREGSSRKVRDEPLQELKLVENGQVMLDPLSLNDYPIEAKQVVKVEMRLV